MIIGEVQGVGNIQDLTAVHLEGWNLIAADPDVLEWLNLPPRVEIDPAKSLADLPGEVRAGPDGFAWRDAVLVDHADSVLAAVQLKVYPCYGERYGLMIDYAVSPDHRGRRIGAQLTSRIADWITSEVPGSHVFIEVCSKNEASLATARILNMDELDLREIDCNIHGGGRHQCDGVANRYCLGAH